eukprot:CAMPEP_0170483478 /NCGR_PEP_ID=MMETSP0208-20121228/3149_1 /TAXON_ID=197538 /ORGANISM="Strombidium inclinatum, Strain S3" /LENGTH=98 /DNA_ID=CAMNT_0010756531 /DNA_START=652 /DNA_END=945 /DNA_ORIENTATION=-
MCPICNKKVSGGDQGFIDHIIGAPHNINPKNGQKINAACPICTSRPGGNPNYKSIDLAGHLELRHGGGCNQKLRNNPADKNGAMMRYYCPDRSHLDAF